MDSQNKGFQSPSHTRELDPNKKSPYDDDKNWRTVYYSKHMEEERSSITKSSETISKAESPNEKAVSKPPASCKTIPVKASPSLLDRENWKTSDINLETAPMRSKSKLDDLKMNIGFFEDLLEDSKEQMLFKDHFEEKVNTKTELGEQERGKMSKTERSVVTIYPSPISQRLMKDFSSSDTSYEKLFTKEEVEEESQNNKNEKEKIKRTTEAKKQTGKFLLWPEKVFIAEEKKHSSHQKADESKLQEAVFSRRTYDDWKKIKQHLMNDFQEIQQQEKLSQNNRIHSHEDLLSTSHYETNKPGKYSIFGSDAINRERVKERKSDTEKTGTWPKAGNTRRSANKNLTKESSDWAKYKEYLLEESVEKCKQEEHKMEEKLKQIHEIVKDVKVLSEKFPTAAETAGSEAEEEKTSGFSLSKLP